MEVFKEIYTLHTRMKKTSSEVSSEKYGIFALKVRKFMLKSAVVYKENIRTFHPFVLIPQNEVVIEGVII